MSLVSIRLPDEVEARLSGEAERAGRSKSEVAREAIVDYLERLERARFLEQIARASRARGDRGALDVAAEALPLDNESLRIREAGGVAESAGRYRSSTARKKNKKNKKPR
jgi:predicted DNA-binding protein